MPASSTHPAPAAEATRDLPPSPPVPPDVQVTAVACANCGAALAGPYCGQCGQHVADYHRSVWRFISDFLDNTFCWDNKFLRTLTPLLREPGLLTREFMAGRRVRYVHPLRLFLFTSAISLALTGFLAHHRSHSGSPVKLHHPASASKVDAGVGGDEEAAPKVGVPPPAASPEITASPATPSKEENSIGNTIQQILASKVGSPSHAMPSKEGVVPTTPTPASEVSSATTGKKEVSPLEARINRVLEDSAAAAEAASAQARARAEKGETPEWAAPENIGRMAEKVTNGIEQRLSWVALALLPVFALMLRAIYWREDSYYFAHLVFSLHYHAFLFVFWMVYACAGIVANVLPLSGLWSFVLALAFFLPGWYLFAALRCLYGESSRRTLAKVLVLGSMHLLIILIGVASAGAMSFFSGKD